MERYRSTGRAILGIILIFIGIFLIASNLHIIPYGWRDLLISWETILIIIGIILLSSRHNQVTGIILIAIGGFFLLPDIFDIPYNLKRLFWPMMFFVIGILILYRAWTPRRPGSRTSDQKDNINFLDDAVIFGGGKRNIYSNNFQGGKVTSIFGGSEFNLMNANLAKGKNYIDVLSIFGGSTYIIPGDWNVKLEITSIFGGFSDKRTVIPDKTPDPEKELIIKGVVIFGGGEIKNF